MVRSSNRYTSDGVRFLPAVVVLAALVALAGLVSVRADGASLDRVHAAAVQ